MRIAAHHVAGTAEHRLSSLLGVETEYKPACAWPDDCTVQWGHGIIPATPFFEAFPRGTFLRGEGPTIADAEQKAFAQYQSEFMCDHVWGRQHVRFGIYTNGAAWCRKCGGFRSKMFPPIVALGWWRKPLDRMEVDMLTSAETDTELNEIMDRKYPDDIAGRRQRARVLRMRFNLFGAQPPTKEPTP